MFGRWTVSFRRLGSAAVGAALFFVVVCPTWAQQVPVPAESTGQSLAETARTLLAQRDADALARLATGLADDHPPGFRVAIAQMLADVPPVPPEIAPALATAIQASSPADLPVLLSAARWTGDRAVVGAVVDLLRRESPALRAQAMSTLRTQTGDAVVTDDPAGWIDWWNRARTGTDGAWWRMIAINRAAANRAVASRLSATEQRMRRLFLEAQAKLSEEQRSAFVAELLASTDARDQAMGLDFAERALLNARTLGAAEVRGAATILQSPNVEVRGRAAALLDRTDPPSLGPEVRTALRAESVPEVAASLLRLIGRRGWCDAEQDVLRWLRKGPGPAYAAALDAGAALLENGCFKTLVDRDELSQHALATVLGPGLTLASPAVAKICAELEITWALRQLLASPVEEVARIAAEALTTDAASVDLIVAAARSREGLFGAAASTIAAHDATVEGMATLVSLPADDATQAAGVGLVARAMDPGDLLVALAAMPTPELRIASLEPVLAAIPLETPPNPVWTRLRMALADALIELARPEGALAALGPATEAARATASVRCMLLVWLGRLDEAVVIPDATVEDWMAGFERSHTSPHAAETARMMESTFAADLTPEMRSRIDALLADAAATDQSP